MFSPENQIMKSPLAEKSVQLSIEVINYYQWLCEEKKEYVMSKQILRSATSIGANIHESLYAASKADFINKMQIAAKEASETEYWILLLEKSDYFDDRFNSIKELLNETKKMLVATLKTAKSNN